MQRSFEKGRRGGRWDEWARGRCRKRRSRRSSGVTGERRRYECRGNCKGEFRGIEIKKDKRW